MSNITGGHARVTGIKEKGPQGPRVAGDRFREVIAGANAPHDAWLETDFTPNVNGRDLGPMPESEAQSGKPYDRQTNPEAQGINAWDGSSTSGDSGNHQIARLVFDYEGEGDVSLVHEGGNHGCTPRIKCIDATGTITNLRFVCFGGVEVTVSPSTIHVGRQ